MGYLEHDPDLQEEFNYISNDPNVTEAYNDFTPDVYNDTCLKIELSIPRYSDRPEIARVMTRLRDKDGMSIVKSSDNPILYIHTYEAEYPD